MASIKLVTLPVLIVLGYTWHIQPASMWIVPCVIRMVGMLQYVGELGLEERTQAFIAAIFNTPINIISLYLYCNDVTILHLPLHLVTVCKMLMVRAICGQLYQVG